MKRAMRLERILWAAFLIPTLLPELEAGVSKAEFFAIMLFLIAGTVLAFNYLRNVRVPGAIWLIVSYLVLSFVGLTHDPFNYFASYLAGSLAFTIGLAVGGCLPDRILGFVAKWLFLLLLIGATLDICMDFMGWTPDADKSKPEWETGVRGLATGQSMNGVYLAPFMAFMVVAAPSGKWRVLGAGAVVVVFYHVVVFGQGRGATSLAFLGMMAVFARELRSLPAVLLVLGPFLAMLAGGFFDEAAAPFIDRVTSQDLSEVDRLQHARVGEKLVRSMSAQEVLVGMDHKKVFVANGGVGMHNAYFDMLTRFGLFATVPLLVFNVVSLIAAGATLLRRELESAHMAAAVVTIQMLIASIAAPIFINWRSCVIPGICIGLVLRAIQSEGGLWSRS